MSCLTAGHSYFRHNKIFYVDEGAHDGRMTENAVLQARPLIISPVRPGMAVYDNFGRVLVIYTQNMQVMKQKVLHTILGVLAISIAFSSCVTHSHTTGNPHGIPPGQQKKIYGTKSAKPFAPGQQKKAY
jgi:hypothetical protein